MKEIENNIGFLLHEVTKQLQGSLEVLKAPGERAIGKIEHRDDYIDNLKSVIENACFSMINQRDARGPVSIHRLRAINIIASNLERIGDHAVNIVGQVRYLSDDCFMHRFDFQTLYIEILRAMDLIHGALVLQNLDNAFKICRTESQLDRHYKDRFDRIVGELHERENTNDLLTALFIFRYLERIGDALLNIGEAAIFSITGNKMKIRQYDALRESLKALGKAMPIDEREFQSIWGTRSGARIGRVQTCAPELGSEQDVIFKEGNREKLVQESRNIQQWESILPGLAPRVVSQQETGEEAALLIECLSGATLEDLVLTADDETLEIALSRLEDTLRELWSKTMKPAPARARFIHQCRQRLGDVFQIHPDFRFPRRDLCGWTVSSFDDLLAEAERMDEAMEAPFSIFIHGDFNTNNILFNPDTGRIHYIDLNRSREMDYLQDVSVFLVSNIRLPVDDEQTRHRIHRVNWRMFCFARNFAHRHGDGTFEMRLALGLIRSLITSVRFDMKKPSAKKLFLLGVYLLERVMRHTTPGEEFHLPQHVLHYG
ncbi:MAG: PhoU domain-containing protein [Syntrophobacteraceae bacterium]